MISWSVELRDRGEMVAAMVIELPAIAPPLTPEQRMAGARDNRLAQTGATLVAQGPIPYATPQ